MGPKLANYWDKIRSSFWFVPFLMCAATAALAWLTLELDQSESLRWAQTYTWLGVGTPEEARHALSTIATSVATIAGVVFSITIVVLTLASAQFGARVVRQFMRDRWTQATLGAFVATFAYCLMVLRAMGPLQHKKHVLDISVSVAVLFGIFSVGVLVLFIHHAAAGIQAANVLEHLNCDLEEVIAANCPPLEDAPSTIDAEFGERGAEILWDRESGYVQAISYGELVRVAQHSDAQIKLLVAPGRFIFAGETCALVAPAERATELGPKLLRLLDAGPQRTQSQDIKFGIEQMVQVALHALSPSLNDPFTANICVDHLASSMTYVMRRQLPPATIADGSGVVRVFRQEITFEELMDVSFAEIRRNAGSQLSVHAHLICSLGRVAALAATLDQRRCIAEHLDLAFAEATRQIMVDHDRSRVMAEYRRARSALDLPLPSRKVA